MRVNPFVFGVAVLAIFLGTITAAQAAGFWSVSGKVTTTGEKVTATGANPDEIKGWMTLEEVSTAYRIPVAELVAAFGLPADVDAKMQIKDLESEQFSVTNLKAWLKTRLAALGEAPSS